MKAFLALAVLLAIASAADDWQVHPEEELMAIRSKCIKEYNVPAALVERIQKFEYDDEESVRCSLKCVAENSGIWDKENGWNVDRFYEQATLEEASIPEKEDLKKCVNARLEGEDDCKWIYRNFKCMIDNKYISKKEA